MRPIYTLNASLPVEPMSRQEFESLPEYCLDDPLGQTTGHIDITKIVPGMRWRKRYGSLWIVCECHHGATPTQTKFESRFIVIQENANE